MNAYGDLAALYDELMDDYDYPAWADYYLSLLSQAGCHPRTLCDCACGTGSLSVEFAGKGISVIGVDVSESMLEAAADKKRARGVEVTFVHQDMCALRLPKPVDALVCGCDGVNYLLTPGQMKSFFQRAHEALRPGGAMAFDISSPYKLERVIGNGFFGEEREDVAYLWSNQWNESTRTVQMNLTFFRKEKNGLYRRFTETHIQRAHEPDAIAELLTRSGFRLLGIYGDRTLDPPKKGELRIHFLAVRE